MANWRKKDGAHLDEDLNLKSVYHSTVKRGILIVSMAQVCACVCGNCMVSKIVLSMEVKAVLIKVNGSLEFFGEF